MAFQFLKQLIRRPYHTGAIAPSSHALAGKMVKPVDFSKAKKIVEFGAGTGAVTREILSRMGTDAKLYAFEINPEFAKELGKIRDSRLRIIRDNCAKLGKYVKHPDAIISGLPLGNFREEDVEEVLETVQKCLNGGVYVQFQYSLLSYSALREHFRVKLGFTPWNIPPAVVYVCRKK